MKCRGCGVALQNERPSEAGYMPQTAKVGEDPICQRCYRTIHYGKVEAAGVGEEQYWAAVRSGVSAAQVVICVIDLMSFEASILPGLLGLVGKKPLVIAVTKADLLPKKTPWAEAQDWISDRLGEYGIRPHSIHLMSATRGEGVGELVAGLQTLVSPGGGVALIGTTNVGKSTLVRALVGISQKELYRQGKPQSQHRLPTVSPVAGTTLGVVEVQLAGLRMKVLDTPGILPEGRMGELVCPQCHVALVPQKQLGARLFQLKAGQALLLGGLAAVEVEEVQAQDPRGLVIVAYGAETLTLHRTKAEKIEEYLGTGLDWLTPPCNSCAKGLSTSWTTHVYTLDSGTDLAISGLGWVSIRGGSGRLRVHLPEGVKVTPRAALTGQKSGLD